MNFGRTQMRKITLFAFAPALIAIGSSIVQGIEPFQKMVNAKELPTVEFADYTFVFV